MPRFTPKIADYRNRVRASFARQAAMQSLGIGLGEIGPGQVVLEMALPPGFTQQHGLLHAGTLATALDSACGYAAFTLFEAGTEVVTVEFKVNLLAPAKGERFRFEAGVVRAGRTITVAEGRALAVDAPDAPLATMSATLMAVTAPPPGRR